MFDSPGTAPLGLSVGATHIAASHAGRTEVRASVLTVRGQRLAGFVDRVGDPVPLVAPDGSDHRPETLLGEALDEAAAAVTGGAPVRDVTITVPAHWRPSVVETLRRTVRGASVVSDATAALAALNADPGLPTRGVLVLCDMGGSATNITLVNASANHAIVGETVRVADLSGDRIDQALLSHLVAGLGSAVNPSMVDVLTTVRAHCRAAKERLSSDTATAVPVELPGRRTEIRITRRELEELTDPMIADFLGALDDTLDRYGVPTAAVSAVATVGGGARIPLLTRRLSEHLRAPVVTTAQPHLSAVQGAVLLAQRARVVDVATTIVDVATHLDTAPDVDQTATVQAALAWSAEEPELPYARPQVEFRPDESVEDLAPPRRAPLVLFALSATAVALTAAVFGLMQLAGGTTPVEAATTVAPSPAPAAPAPSPALPAPQATSVTTVVVKPVQRAAPPPHAPAVQTPASSVAPPPPAPAPSAAPVAPPPPTWTPPPTWIPPWVHHTPPAQPPSEPPPPAEPPADTPPPGDTQSGGGGTDTGTAPAQPDGGTDATPDAPPTGDTA
jgi:actin-like ATPase involved in cell morphogenesis